MVKESTKLLSSEAIAYRSMKAHEMHLRVKSVKVEKGTCESSVAATFM